MDGILHDFYYGNLSTMPQEIVKGSEEERLLRGVSEAETTLLALLNDDTARLALGALTDQQVQLNAITGERAFINGFCIGMRFAVAALYPSTQENTG